MPILTAILGGIIPMVIYPLFIYWMDRYEKEPLGLLVAVFLWGFIPAAILSLIAQLIFGVPFLLIDDTGALADIVGAAVLAPTTEEVFKGLAVLLIFTLWRNQFDGVFDGIIYGALVGFGFASIENILYFADSGIELFPMRAIIFGLNHAMFTSLTGIGFGVARHTRKGFGRFIAPLVGLLAAITLHTIHNMTVSFAEDAPGLLCLTFLTDYGGVILVFVIMVLAIRRERQWIIDELKGEVENHTLSKLQYEVVCSPVRRFTARLAALSRWRKVGQYFHTLTKLAYTKHARSRRGDAGAQESVIAQLRSEAKTKSAELNGIIS
jgi:RsiW-degrading membrane proteinase PrsW (M82 family)